MRACASFAAVAAAVAASCAPADAPPRAAAGSATAARRGVSWLPARAAAGDTAFRWAGRVAPRADVVAAGVQAVADWHLAREAARDRLPAAALAAAAPALVHDTGRGGVLVTYVQQPDGVEVFGQRLSLMMTRDGRLVAVAGRLHPAAVPGITAKLGGFPLRPEAAAAAALSDARGVAISAAAFVDRGERPGHYRALQLAASRPPSLAGVSLARPARAKRVLYPDGDTLRTAYYVELDITEPGSTDAFAWAYVVDARDGAILTRYPLTFSDRFEYRVWAEPTAPWRPDDGPNNDATPHPTGTPDGYDPGFAAPRLVDIEGFNTNPDGTADPWLPAGATVTTGNNVDAYADHNAPDGFSDGDIRATTTGDRSFDRIYDVTLAPSANPEQVQAAITQIFYTVNWLHDWYYDSGFDEASGVAQADNYGRGGIDGDPLLAEAQDTNGRTLDNANMSAFADGSSPRMQMYLWSGKRTDVGETRFEITEPESIAGTYRVSASAFGPTEETSATGPLVLIDDGSANPTRACEAIDGDLSGAIAVADRGDCTFVTKARNAQQAGAAALIIVNNDTADPSALPPLGGDATDIDIPVLGLAYTDGTAIKDALGAASARATASRAGFIEGLRHDGTIDNGVVAHEWGHYLHARLGRCGGSQQCAGHGEGWGDFVALHMIVREGDDYDGTYAVAGYATANQSEDSYYFGIRRVPYSTDMTKNALTFRHISDGEPLPDSHPIREFGPNSEVHNAGEVWATMLHEGHIALITDGRLSFDEAHRRMSDYVVAGLKLSGANPTYTEMRDAILAAAAAADSKDFAALAAAFAKRGLGTGAVSPPRDSIDLTGVVESFDVAGQLGLTDVAAVLGDGDCDGDGVLDAGETGVIDVTVTNTGAAALKATTVTLSTSTPGVRFPAGDTLSLARLEPFDSATASFEVAIDDTVEGIQVLALDVTLADDAAVVTDVTSTVHRRINYDVQLAASATDDVEADATVWAVEADPATPVVDAWQRVAASPTEHEWHGEDLGEPSDHWLRSPAVHVSDDGEFTVAFDHRYRFEASEQGGPGGQIVYWDGGVIEISTDGGTTWTDVADFADPGYGGTITTQAGNPLGGRNAFVGQSADYPNMTHTELRFGDRFAGQTVALRFRIGTDAAVGDAGWFIDNIALAGIDDTPFAVIADNAECAATPPGPDAGVDDPGDAGGCGCAATGGGRTAAGAWLLWLGVGAWLTRRRRRRARA
ncbi:MAG: peptidase [Deltaproteobacteria bacterium]|nr:MAG: peptidase [Deltaproteobacteria bacterium]